MDIMEAMRNRRSVRQYTDTPIPPDVLDALRREIDVCNREGDLHIQLVTDEPKAFSGMMAKYGKFSGVHNYFALVGQKDEYLEENCGYYGERLVLLAQQLGLNTCWVAMTYRKVPGAFQVDKGEKLTVVIAVGYGANPGVPHKSKKPEEVSETGIYPCDWFRRGVEAALLAPTAMNQQKFFFTDHGDGVEAKAGIGFYTKIDLGIAKYHFEIAADTKNFYWDE
ncbi:MAG: nitroreductase family protein [Clostridia bacterium]|nr:nitroreductase family protein [Clostridia bacterium]